MKTRHIVMAVALPVAAWLAFFGDKTPPAGIAEPIVRSAMEAAPAPVSQDRRRPEVPDMPHILALAARESLIGGAHAQTPEGAALFASQSWMPPPPPPPKPLPPPAPTAPPLPFTYLGKMERDNTWEVYLARGDKTYIVRNQTVVDGTYRIDAIKPPTLSLTYLPLKQAQTLTIGGSD